MYIMLHTAVRVCIFMILLNVSFLSANSFGNVLRDCNQCANLADGVIGDFSSGKWFKKYEADGLVKPFKKAGYKTCLEFKSVRKCFNECTNTGGAKSYPQSDSINDLISNYCEEIKVNGKVCRLADIRICDVKHNKLSCGDELNQYLSCVQRVLDNGDQSCWGVCTPARRFHKTSLFELKVECDLKTAGLCRDYIQLFCFSGLKDTDYSWGYFNNLHQREDTRDLNRFCPELSEISSCMQRTVTDSVDYFGLQLNKPCSDLAPKITQLKNRWDTIINPICQARKPGQNTVGQVCADKFKAVQNPLDVKSKTSLLQKLRANYNLAASKAN